MRFQAIILPLCLSLVSSGAYAQSAGSDYYTCSVTKTWSVPKIKPVTRNFYYNLNRIYVQKQYQYIDGENVYRSVCGYSYRDNSQTCMIRGTSISMSHIMRSPSMTIDSMVTIDLKTGILTGRMKNVSFVIGGEEAYTMKGTCKKGVAFYSDK